MKRNILVFLAWLIGSVIVALLWTLCVIALHLPNSISDAVALDGGVVLGAVFTISLLCALDILTDRMGA